MVADIDFDDADYTDDNLTSGTRTIDGSEINVSFDKSDIDEAMPNAEGVLVGTLELSSVSDYTIESLKVSVVTTGSGVVELIDDLELDGSSYDTLSGSSSDSDTTAEFIFEDIDLSAGEDLELDLTFDVIDDTTLNGDDVTFEIEIVKVTDEENDETYTGSSELSDILSTNSLDDKTIDIESASLTITQTTMTSDELVLGNGVEVILYKGKLSVGDSDSVTLDDLIFTGSLTDSGSSPITAYDFDDIIDSVELNIDGETFDGDVESDTIEFTSMNAEIEAGSDNLIVTVTAILEDTDDVNQGDVLVIDAIDTDEISVEDSEGEDLLAGNITINESNTDTEIELNENGSLDFAIVNGGDNEDEIEAVVLAGTSSVGLAEVELEANDEDMKIKELVFTATGDVSTTLDDVRLLNGSSIIADGAVVTYDSTAGKTTITFEDDFVIEDSSDEIEAVLVADLNTYTTEGGEVSASVIDMNFVVDSIEVK
jgi:hypothetical protein